MAVVIDLTGHDTSAFDESGLLPPGSQLTTDPATGHHLVVLGDTTLRLTPAQFDSLVSYMSLWWTEPPNPRQAMEDEPPVMPYVHASSVAHAAVALQAMVESPAAVLEPMAKALAQTIQWENLVLALAELETARATINKFLRRAA